MNDREIIEVLGGVTAVARMLEIRPPSVHGWLETGIPEGRLRDLAAQIELRSGGRFTRRQRWPEKFGFYWPELITANCAQPLADIATPQPTTTEPDAMGQQLQRGLDRATDQLATDPESRIAKLVSTNRTQAQAEVATHQPTPEPAAAGV